MKYCNREKFHCFHILNDSIVMINSIPGIPVFCAIRGRHVSSLGQYANK